MCVTIWGLKLTTLLNSVLFLVSLITFSIFLHRHRMQTAAASQGYMGDPQAAAQPPVDMQNLGYAPKEQVSYTQQPVYQN